jgi:hypothetical protein
VGAMVKQTATLQTTYEILEETFECPRDSPAVVNA